MSINLREELLKLQNREAQASVAKKRVLIVDGMNSFIRCFAATPTMNDEGQHVGGLTGFLLSLGAAIRQFKPNKVVIIFDGKGGSQKRRAIYEGYKDNRRNMTRLNRTYGFDSVEKEEEVRKWQLVSLVEILKSLPVVVMAPDNVEADDAIAYLAEHIADRNEYALIMSNDRDFLQLVRENINIWNPASKMLMGVQQVIEKYGVHPNNFVFYRTLTGDDSDNIPGIKGVGPKVALKLFPELGNERPVTIEELIQSAKEKGEKSKVAQSIAEGQKQLELNYSLMRLDDVAMSGMTRINVLDRYEKTYSQFSKLDFIKCVHKLKIMNAFGNFEQWLTAFYPLLEKKPND